MKVQQELMRHTSIQMTKDAMGGRWRKTNAGLTARLSGRSSARTCRIQPQTRRLQLFKAVRISKIEKILIRGQSH